jgi:hypothetical protein
VLQDSDYYQMVHAKKELLKDVLLMHLMDFVKHAKNHSLLNILDFVYQWDVQK